MTRFGLFAFLTLCSFVVSGCAKSSPAPNSASSQSTSQTESPTGSTAKETKYESKFWEDFPDAPKIDVVTEIDGIKIPRVAAKRTGLQMTGPIPVDVGNEHAHQSDKKQPSQPVTGDTLTIRFGAEPKVLNAITENSAVMRYITKEYVNDSLAHQNLETFEFEPAIASKWVFEDSVKLSADYPGRERRVAKGDDTPQATFEFDYTLPPPKGNKPDEAPKVVFKTTDQEGKPAGKTWVGLFAVGRIPGAPLTGYHYWTDENGKLEVSGFPTGKYTVKTGDEVFGLTKQEDDKSLTVTAGTPENPLREPLTLKEGEWQDIQLRTYATFYLREEAKWSDGAPYTSKDVQFVHSLMNSQYVDGDSIRTYYQDIVECTPIGPHVVRMRHRRQYFLSDIFFEIGIYGAPFHFFEDIFRAQGRELTFERLTPEEEAAQKKISVHGQEFGKFFNTDERYNSKPLGNGPYIVDKWERKDRVELVRNPNHWDKSRAGYIDRIIVKFIPDQVTALTALRAGEIDFLYDMAPEQYFDDWSTLDQQTQDTYVKASWYVPVYQYVGWNELATPFKDPRVRMALTMLFDRQEFIDKKMHGEAIVVSGTQYLFGNGYDNECPPVAYDPETARELLSQAGWIDTDNDGILDKNGEKFQFTMRMGLGRAIYSQISEVMQRNFKSVGIDMQIQMMEWASFVDKLQSKECDALMLRWTMPPESDPFQIWHSSEGAREKRGSNFISFRNQQADDLIELIRVTLDPVKRHRLHQSFHRLLDREQPYMFLWTPKEFGAYHKRFRNVKWYRLRPGFNLAEWYVPKDEQLHNPGL